jgi:serine/threonine protein kinase
MRYIEGGTLADLLQGQPFPLPKIRHIISQIGDALDYAYSRGVVHRDVKPSNVLIDERGNCLLTDFGMAKMLEAAAQFTVSGSFVSTPTYASPEQCLGHDLNGRSDIYSLGAAPLLPHLSESHPGPGHPTSAEQRRPGFQWLRDHPLRHWQRGRAR